MENELQKNKNGLIDITEISSEDIELAKMTTFEEIEEGIKTSKKVLKYNFIKIGELLYIEQIKYNLELSKKFNTNNLKTLKNADRKGTGYYEYACNKHNISKSFLIKELMLYKRFGETFKRTSSLPFAEVTKLEIVAHMSDEEIDEILHETYIFNKNEIKGGDLNQTQLRQVVQEKRELQKLLDKQEKEKDKDISDKAAIIVKLTQEKKALEYEFDEKLSEQLKKATEDLSKTVEGQIKAKLSKQIMDANDSIKKANVEQGKAKAELKKLENTIKALDKQEKENNRILNIINEKEKVMEDYDKNRRVLESKINELTSTVEGLNNQKKDLVDGIQRVKEISEFTKCLNQMITLSNEFEKDVYSSYIAHEDIRKYLVPTVANALESLHRFDDKLHNLFKPTIVVAEGVEVTNE